MCKATSREEANMNVLSLILALTVVVWSNPVRAGAPLGAPEVYIAPGQSITMPAPIGTTSAVLGLGYDHQFRERDAGNKSYRVFPNRFNTDDTVNRWTKTVDVIDTIAKYNAYVKLGILRAGTGGGSNQRYMVVSVMRIQKIVTLLDEISPLTDAHFYAKRIYFGYAYHYVLQGESTEFTQEAALSIGKFGVGAEKIIRERNLHVEVQAIGLNPIEESDKMAVFSAEDALHQKFRPGPSMQPIAVEYVAMKDVPQQRLPWESSKLRSGTYVLSRINIQVSRTKDDGRPWDVFDGPPDPFTAVLIDGKQVATCFRRDVYEADCRQDNRVELRADSVLRVVVIDRDINEHDPIGEVTLRDTMRNGLAYDLFDLAPTTSSQLERVQLQLIPVRGSAAPEEVPSTRGSDSIEDVRGEASRPPKLLAPALQDPRGQIFPEIPKVAEAAEQYTPPIDATQSTNALVAPITYPSGLRVQRVSHGRGRPARLGQQVLVQHLVRSASSGQIYENSLVGNRPLVFRLGMSDVMRGMDEGVMEMTTGERRRLFVPAELGYRTVRSTTAPQNRTGDDLIIDVVLVRILSSDSVTE